MSKCVRSARVRRVSSQATRSTSRRTRSARRVMSSRLPIGVATTKSVPLRLRRLLLRFRDEQGPLVVQDDLARDDALLEPLDGRQLVHDLEHDLLQDRPESPRAGPPLERLLRDRRHRVVRELQADLLEVKYFWYCLVIAFFGSLRMRISAVSSRSWSVAMTGSRPTNSGMSPYFRRSSGWIITRRSPTRRSSRRLISAPKPMPERPTRASMILSSPTKAPPHRKRTFDVSTWMNSWCGCFRPPWGGTLATVPSRIFRSAC